MPGILTWEFLQVCKKRLQKGKAMNAEIFVDDARERVKEMVRWESRGPGDIENAMLRIAGHTSVPYGELWKLRYRPGKSIDAHIYAAIVLGYEQWREHQRREFLDERGAANPQSLLARLFVRAADAVAGQEDRP
jgi:hypothetical protein